MTHADYLSHPAYGSSDIIKMSKSFAYWKAQKSVPTPKTRPLVIGSATHLMLQAEVTGASFLLDGLTVYKDGSSLTNGFKDFQATNKDRYCLDEKEHKLCQRMVKALMDDGEVMGYVKDAVAEPTIIAPFPGTLIQAKCRPDYLHERRGVSINLKTAQDASESGFLYSTRDYGYDWQSAFYCALLSEQFGRPFDEVHILVEKGDTQEECVVEIFSFNDETLGFARSQIWELLQQTPECEKTGIWPKKRAYLKMTDLPLHMRRVFSL